MSAKQKHSLAMKRAIGLCIQGDVTGAYEYLLRQADIGSEEREFARQLRIRFLENNPDFQINSADTWVQNVVAIYYRYFTCVLTKRMSLDQGEDMLLAELSNVVAAQNIEEAEEKLKQEFHARGYYFLGGKTLPFWGPYIWKAQDSRMAMSNHSRDSGRNNPRRRPTRQ
ncbi:hypothetical protein [Alicyclobacillus acidiphilus]|uniref:hypothetical protein n=1 Tax=Alicyclobacillus acidiphilus TaxID=182455 RepID=UPI00082EEEFC|nr:hypothetical protein [Alicyclobacillus acidiphilus]